MEEIEEELQQIIRNDLSRNNNFFSRKSHDLVKLKDMSYYSSYFLEFYAARIKIWYMEMILVYIGNLCR